MAFCDNPRCRWHNANGARVVYDRLIHPMRVASLDDPFKPFVPIGEYKRVVVNNHVFRDTITNGYHDPIQRFFCDECRELVFEAFDMIREACKLDRLFLAKSDDPNFLIEAVESAWIRREERRKNAKQVLSI